MFKSKFATVADICESAEVCSTYVLPAAESLMYQTVTLYRVVCFRQPRGPWRLDRIRAEQDAVEERLGCYDEWGRFWATVPGDIETLSLPVSLVEGALERATPHRRVA
jgi:hypothetical protein